MGYQSNRPPHPHILIAAKAGWIDAVRTESATLDAAIRIEQADSAADAVDRLAAAGQDYSHLLLDPDVAGSLFATLVGLTAGEDSSGVALVVLGADGLPPHATEQPHLRVVHDTRAGWLSRALFAPAHPASADPPPDIGDLRAALASPRIHARYQPIVRIADRMPVGLEVLARFDHPVHGTMRPDLFVPQIEAAGLAWPLTETMIARAFADWPGGTLDRFGLFITVNFPLDVLLLPDALAWLDQRRAEADIPAEHIVVELTESRPVERLPELKRAVEQLRGLGYGLAIDDVGPDIRDHSALLDLPFTALKLDKDVVRDAPGTPAAAAFLAATVAAARRAGLTVVAEGVETPEIWARMAEAGVDQAQGFLVARPLPAAAVASWHADWCARFTR